MRNQPFPQPIYLLPEDPIYGLQDKFRHDTRIDKLNLAIGVVPSAINTHQPYYFPSVKKALLDTLEDTTFTLSYLPIAGNSSLIQRIQLLLQLPHHSNASFSSIGIQTIGGTGALSTLGKLLYQQGITDIVFGSPTWINHHHIFSSIGYQCHEWQWLNNTQKNVSTDSHINIDSFVKRLEILKKNSRYTAGKEILFLFHLICHNPTGIDPTKTEWEYLLTSVKRYFPNAHILFDCAYYGFHSQGDTATLFPLQLCLKLQIQHAIAFSCSKTFGIYSERVGAALYVGYEEWLPAIRSHMESIQRSLFSSTSKIGATAVAKVLSQESVYHDDWKNNLQRIASTIRTIRKRISQDAALMSLDLPLIDQGEGLFALLPITKSEVKKLREEHAIFITDDSRINICALQRDEDRTRVLHYLKKIVISR